MKILKIESCKQCSNYIYYTNDFLPPYPKVYMYCNAKEGKRLESTDIPKWCPLEDAVK